jgi:hypothetical protein
MSLPFVLADSSLPIDVGDVLTYQMTRELQYEGDRLNRNENSATTLGGTTLTLILGDSLGNIRFSEGPNSPFPGWENWTIYRNDTYYEHSFTDPEDVEKEDSEPISLRETILYDRFLLIFTGPYPISNVRENRERFPILMNKTSWNSFPDDAQITVQNFINNAELLNNSINATADTNSISIERHSYDINETEKFFIKYSKDGICELFTYFRETETWNDNFHIIYNTSITISQIPPTISGYPLRIFGLMVLGFIGIIMKFRKRLQK